MLRLLDLPGCATDERLVNTLLLDIASYFREPTTEPRRGVGPVAVEIVNTSIG